MKYGLIGQTLSHSFSPELHQLIGGYDYALWELPPHELPRFLERREFSGINVTIPYKEVVIPYLDHLDPTAASAGAVNTIVNRQGKLIGYNTDIDGLLAMTRRMKLSFADKKVLILGTGGAAKTARASAELLGASEILSVSRTPSEREISYAEAAARHADTNILINATPCGMYPALEECPIDLDGFPALHAVLDVIYNPLATRLVLEARNRGIPAMGGLYMLAAQAAGASALFAGSEISGDVAETAYTQLLRHKQNLVLIGMPGCGKTTVGRELARQTGRDLVDLDQMICEDAGRTIAEIFQEGGETDFREREAAAIRRIAGQTGIIIATGGGCVLRPDNVALLRQNGLLFLLDRPWETLVPSADRPLSDSPQKLRRLYRQRMPIYRAAADAVISAENSASTTAQTVLQRFHEVILP